MHLTDSAPLRMKPRTWPTAFLLALLLLGCSSQSKHPAGMGSVIAIDGVQIINKLSITVTDVQILVPKTGNFVSCGTILRNTSCSTSFPGREYERSPVQVSWKEQAQGHTTGNFVIEPPAGLDPSRPMWIEVVIFAPGQAGAKLVQHPQKAGPG
jgi:hypothetical protein